MAKIHLEVASCSQCPKMKETNPWSSDGWDRMVDWVCVVENRMIAKAVEWHDKPKIPEWCPLACKDNTDVRPDEKK